MVQTRSLSRFVTRLAAVAPLTAMLSLSCGSSTPASGDAESPDAAPNDAATALEGSASHDEATVDGSRDEAIVDGSAMDRSASDDSSPSDVTVTDASPMDSHGDVAKVLVATDGNVPFMTTILGSSARFAVFSGGTVENAAGTATTLKGDLGTYPGSAAVGLTPPVVVGTTHLGDEVANLAAKDIASAYEKLLSSNLPCHTDLTGVDLGGKMLGPGVYCFASTAGLTGTLTLDAQHKPNAVWVFQVGSALTTAANSRVVVINGTAAQACNAFWQITSAATLGTNSAFGGTILASAAVTVTTGTSIVGRAFALTAKVSTDTNIISVAECPVSTPMPDGG